MKYIAVCLKALVAGIFPIAGPVQQTGATELWKTLPASLPPPPANETGYAKVNGVEIHCAIYGAGDPSIQPS